MTTVRGPERGTNSFLIPIHGMGGPSSMAPPAPSRTRWPWRSTATSSLCRPAALTPATATHASFPCMLGPADARAAAVLPTPLKLSKAAN
eukprot:5825033-Pyramimonas_sp.AAC.1